MVTEIGNCKPVSLFRVPYLVGDVRVVRWHKEVNHVRPVDVVVAGQDFIEGVYQRVTAVL